MATNAPLKTTYLNQFHKKIGAKMVPFGGFEMPVWYTTIAEEHHAVRREAGIFDISHMGVLAITGKDAEAFLQNLGCNDVKKAKNGKMIYSMMLNEKGTVLDDIMLGELAENTWIVVVNASNLPKILGWITPKLIGDVHIEDRTQTYSFFAVQGPKAVDKLASLIDSEIVNTPRFALYTCVVQGHPCTVMRTGYTGEDGAEISVPNSIAQKVFQDMLDAGITPCGLGARDTLRLEAGLPLYGQELSEEITPLMTRYKWAVKFDTHFIGKDQLLKDQDHPQPYTTVGIIMDGKLIPRTHYDIKEGGYVTSGTLSPTLIKPIAMALVPPEYAKEGTPLTVIIRGKEETGVVVKLPFVSAGQK